MKIAFFLLPKSEIVCFDNKINVRQAIERMDYHHLSAVPMVDEAGKYIGTLSASDLLWKLKETPSYTYTDTAKIKLSEVPLHWDVQPVHIDATVQDLMARALNQNFIPVVDDYNTFIGIVRRREIIEYCIRSISDNPTETVAKGADSNTLTLDDLANIADASE